MFVAAVCAAAGLCRGLVFPMLSLRDSFVSYGSPARAMLMFVCRARVCRAMEGERGVFGVCVVLSTSRFCAL